MAEHRMPFEDEVARLKTLRDELRVQLDLAKKEARERFEQAEKSWHKLEGRIQLVRKESAGQMHDVGEAARGLLKEIQDAYKHIRELL